MLISYLLLFLSLITPTLSCGTDGNQCDTWSPCCSSHGFCGNGYNFCGIGCQKEYSITDDNGKNACLLPPACESKMYQFTDSSKFHPLDNYTGDYRSVEWATTGQVEIQNNQLLIKMPKGSGGGRITSTRYVNFAKITASLKTSKGAGVITSFITMAEDKDEIDFEWIGSNLNEVQSNYYYRGILDLTKGMKHPIQSSSYSEYHDYTIDWKEDELNWLVDNKIVRTLKKSDTLKDGQYNYPSSPSRIEIGIWDGGAGAEGTKEWAGGSINWDDPDITKQGYLFMALKSVNVECYGPATSSDNDFSLVFEDGDNSNNNGMGLQVKTFYNSNGLTLYPNLILSTLLSIIYYSLINI
ncbi:hypothetical protein K502DRAFT_338766 [Neoconidiobolus thromboides FSU 785]|nr:hypothetical protein K502DRAFT_338766 [Neoconidiobolus thromboides FSU 785]